MCNHQDMAGVGAALPDALRYFRIAKLKKKWAATPIAHRTIRRRRKCSEACGDRLGMLVLDENRLFGEVTRKIWGNKEQILRDRNHPSVFA